MENRYCRTEGCGNIVNCKHRINLHCDSCLEAIKKKWLPLMTADKNDLQGGIKGEK